MHYKLRRQSYGFECKSINSSEVKQTVQAHIAKMCCYVILKSVFLTLHHQTSILMTLGDWGFCKKYRWSPHLIGAIAIQQNCPLTTQFPQHSVLPNVPWGIFEWILPAFPCVSTAAGLWSQEVCFCSLTGVIGRKLVINGSSKSSSVPRLFWQQELFNDCKKKTTHGLFSF